MTTSGRRLMALAALVLLSSAAIAQDAATVSGTVSSAAMVSKVLSTTYFLARPWTRATSQSSVPSPPSS